MLQECPRARPAGGQLGGAVGVARGAGFSAVVAGGFGDGIIIVTRLAS